MKSSNRSSSSSDGVDGKDNDTEAVAMTTIPSTITEYNGKYMPSIKYCPLFFHIPNVLRKSTKWKSIKWKVEHILSGDIRFSFSFSWIIVEKSKMQGEYY